MADIHYIKNVTAFSNFAASAGEFSTQLTSMPDYNPDEVIIRALNFNGDVADGNLYLVWSNLTNDYIGSFCGGSLSPHFPQTKIHLNSPVPNRLEFKLFTAIGGAALQVTSMTGDLAIHMDFIKYKRTPLLNA